jgi:hypothetical protein
LQKAKRCATTAQATKPSQKMAWRPPLGRETALETAEVPALEATRETQARRKSRKTSWRSWHEREDGLHA